MKFTKTNDIYKVVRITGGYDNILGVCFTEKDNEPLEIIEWDLKNKIQRPLRLRDLKYSHKLFLV